MSTHTVYLTIERARRGWIGDLRISRISRKRPALARPTEQALVRLRIELPNADKVFRPTEISVAIREDHIALPPETKASAEKPTLS